MKKILVILLAFATLLGCKPKYELNTAFTAPSELDAPEDVILDVTSSERVVFFWSGGKADDGGIILYEVLFDKEGGDFSAPLATFQSDRGSQSRLTLSQAQLNAIARDGGVSRGQTGKFLWTVKASRGGVVKSCGIVKEITITRGNDIDALPEALTPAGTAFTEAGQNFRLLSAGVFTLITRVQAGTMSFANGADNYYVDNKGKLVIGDGAQDVTTVPESGIARVTVDFNTLSVTMDELSATVQAQWAANNTAFIILKYKGDGVYSGKGMCTLLGPGRPGTPAWCSWTEQRYSFMTEVNGKTVRWGSRWPNPDGADSPTYPESAEDYYIYEVAKTDWGNLWKMYESFDQKPVELSIFLDGEGHLTHSVALTELDPEPDPGAPYVISGAGAEVQDQEFVQIDENIYRIYAKLAGGAITVSNGTDSHDYTVNATPAGADATRLTVNISTNEVTEVVVNKVRVLFAADFSDIATLTYQGAGVWKGTGGAWYRDMGGWWDERYYFIPTTDGQQTLCWGRKDTTDPENRPDGNQAADYFDCAEFGWSQWEHCWKLPTEANNGKMTTFTLYTNLNGVMTHTVTFE